MDVFEARRGAIDRMGAPIEVVPLPAFFAATGVDDAPPLAVAPTPALERAVEARAGGAVEEDSAKAQRVARESALDERTFAEPLYSTMSEGAVSYAQKLLAAATRCSVEHGEVLRCCLPVDPLERARFRVMELAILRVALSELELRAPASVVIYEAEMCTKDYCEVRPSTRSLCRRAARERVRATRADRGCIRSCARTPPPPPRTHAHSHIRHAAPRRAAPRVQAGMHVPVRRVLTTYLSETTRGGENGWGAAKPEAPWDYHPEMLLNPKKTQAKAVGAGPKRSASKEADEEPAGLTPRALEAEGGVAPAPSSSGTSNVVTGTDAASAELDALLGEQVRGAEEAADAVARRAEEGVAAVSNAESEVEEDGLIAGGEDMSVDSEDDNEELWDELADEMLDDAEDDQGDAPEAAPISAVEQRNRARVENVMSKFAEKQAAAAGKQRPRDGPKQSRRTGESGGAAADDDDDDSDILDEIDLLTEGYNVRETKPQGFGR